MIANRKGFSLIGTLMAMTVSVIILVGVMYLITDVYEAKQQINSQATIDTFHAASLQTIRNSTRVRSITGVDTDPNLEACLGGRGVNCTTFANLGPRAFDPAGLNLNGTFSSQGPCTAAPNDPSCNISRNASFSFECPTATTCTAIRILTTTNYVRSARTPASVQNITGRSSTITIPGALVVSRNAIDFSCGSTQLVTSVDYSNLRGVCSTVTGNVSSPNLEPLRSFGPSAPTTVYQETLADNSCPSTGFGAIGLYSAQTSCQPAPPPPIPTNCLGSWSACSLACGGGTQTYSIFTRPRNGGAACPYSQGQTQACNTQPCPVNCVGAWSACSVPCGGGTSTYIVSSPAVGGGAACPFANGTTMACNTQSCSPPLAIVLPARVTGNNGRSWAMGTFLPPSNGRINAWLIDFRFSATGGRGGPYTYSYRWLRHNGERVIFFDSRTGQLTIQDDRNRNSSFEISVTDGVSTATQVINFNMWW